MDNEPYLGGGRSIINPLSGGKIMNPLSFYLRGWVDSEPSIWGWVDNKPSIRGWVDNEPSIWGVGWIEGFS